jgi:lysyl endopeptidase
MNANRTRVNRKIATIVGFLIVLIVFLASVWFQGSRSTDKGRGEAPSVDSTQDSGAGNGAITGAPSSGGRKKNSVSQVSADPTAVQARFVAPPLDLEPIRQAAERYEETGVYRFAHGIRVSLTPANAGTWSDGADGQRIWRLSVSSPGAVSLNLGFERYAMPEGGTLTIRSAEDDAGPGTRIFTARDNEEHGQLWTPLFDGDRVELEARVPASGEKDLDLMLTRVNHGFRAAERSLERVGDSASDGCHIDVACSAETLPGIGHFVDAYRDQIRSVGAFTLNGVETCTGALINNTANDRRPFFLTARHCGITTGNAPSMVVYWNFESSTCRTPGCCGSDSPAGGRLDQFNTGAILRASYAPSDVALVELDDPVDPEADPFFCRMGPQRSPGGELRRHSPPGPFGKAYQLRDVGHDHHFVGREYRSR